MPSRWNLPESIEIKRLFSFYGSKQKSAEKNSVWLKVFSGEQVFIAGGETSLFLPFKDLYCIVLDKPALFQRWKNPFSKLDPVKVAKIRAEVFGINLIERDASFSVESFLKRDSIGIEDKREEKKAEIISDVLKPGEKILPARFIDYIVNDFEKGKRVLVLNSRTESSDMLFCPECKKVIRCPNCSGVLKVSKDFKASCYSCDLKDKIIKNCSKCNNRLILIKSISMESLKDSIEEKIGGGKINVISEDLWDSGSDNSEVLNGMITISSPEIVTKISEKVFDRIYFIKPESFININEFNGSEMLFSLIWNLKSLIIPNGTITIISVFHFHYMLKLINSENDYFERELKYRSFFLLPPYKNIFGIEIKNGEIRSLGSRMRKIYSMYGDKLNISKIYIKSRKKVRGKYHGLLNYIRQGKR
jgi:primosomal protein N' (replication factor Y)